MNTRADGVTLGECDLNFISVKQMDEIESICGTPGTVDTPADNQCRIRAVVSPDPTSAAGKRKLYKVITPPRLREPETSPSSPCVIDLLDTGLAQW